MKRITITSGVLAAVLAAVSAQAEVKEMKQTIYGMD